MIRTPTYLVDRLSALLQDENGASAVEYGLLVALIAGVIISVVILLGISVSGGFEDFNSRFLP